MLDHKKGRLELCKQEENFDRSPSKESFMKQQILLVALSSSAKKINEAEMVELVRRSGINFRFKFFFRFRDLTYETFTRVYVRDKNISVIAHDRVQGFLICLIYTMNDYFKERFRDGDDGVNIVSVDATQVEKLQSSTQGPRDLCLTIVYKGQPSRGLMKDICTWLKKKKIQQEKKDDGSFKMSLFFEIKTSMNDDSH